MKKILHLISSPVRGGAEMIAQELSIRHDADLVSIKSLFNSKKEALKFNGLLFLVKSIFQKRIKKIFAHTPMSFLLALFLFSFRKVEIVYVMHSRANLILKYMPYLRYFLSKKKVICVSETVYEDASKNFCNSPLIKINNIVLKSMLSGSRKQNSNVTPSYVYIGRISKEKGIYELIKHCNKANIKLKVFGEHQMTKLTSNDLIHYYGWEDYPFDKLGINDLIVLPSKSESFSIVMNDALQCGINIAVRDPSLKQSIDSTEKLDFLHTFNSFEELDLILKKNRNTNLFKFYGPDEDELTNWAEDYLKS